MSRTPRNPPSPVKSVSSNRPVSRNRPAQRCPVRCRRCHQSRHKRRIERMSQWTERHYLLTDLLLTILVAWMLLSINPSVIYAEGLQLDNRFDRALTIIILIPLIFRRRFPESSALAVAILAALQLLFFGQPGRYPCFPCGPVFRGVVRP